MRRIRIDFAPAGVARSVYQTPFLIWTLFLAGLVVCAGALIVGFDQQRKIDHQHELIQNINLKLAVHNDIDPVTEKQRITDAEASAVNTAIAQLNLPWNAVLDAFEAATPQSIALLSLEPDARRHSVKGIAEAKDSEAMVRYIEQLKKQTLFSDVFIVMHDINQLDPNKPMRFQFEAYWQGGRA